MSMTMEQLIGVDEKELPLENIVSDGGYCGIFRTIACVGDSLSSGEFEATDEEGKTTFHDMFDYSWGQYLARMAGCKVYNFSRGGMTAKEYCNSFAKTNNFWSPKLAAQAYILALGVNDIHGQEQPVGSIADICDEDPEQNADTFAGYYARIIQRYKKIEPEARFFLMTMPALKGDQKHYKEDEKHSALLYKMAEHFSNTYVLDIRKYGPRYDDEAFCRKFLMGHMTPTGYVLTARMVASYIDYIIRHHMEDFRQVGFIGTPFRNTKDVL